MATDNFLDKKSVLGLAERVPMCPPPEIFNWRSINWTTGGRNQQHYIQSATINDADTIDIANKMPRNGMNICSFYEKNTNQLTFAPIIKFSDTVFYGMGVTKDGRVLYITMTMTSSSINSFSVQIHCFGTPIQ